METSKDKKEEEKRECVEDMNGDCYYCGRNMLKPQSWHHPACPKSRGEDRDCICPKEDCPKKSPSKEQIEEWRKELFAEIFELKTLHNKYWILLEENVLKAELAWEKLLRKAVEKEREKIVDAVVKWIFENHDHHVDSEMPYVDSLELEKFVKSLKQKINGKAK